MSGLDENDLREIAVQSAWGAAFVRSLFGMWSMLSIELATRQATAHADQVADLARQALKREAPK